MFRYSFCIFLVVLIPTFLIPGLVSAAAVPWPGPGPTLIRPEADNWSPAPTQWPEVGIVELLKRAQGDNTCGYIDQQGQVLTLTCPSSYTCTTSKANNVHGCCDPRGTECFIPTTCVPKIQMSDCGQSCMSNSYITKCTENGLPECRQWIYLYASDVVFTEHGCGNSAFKATVPTSRPSYSMITTRPSTPTTPTTTNTSLSPTKPTTSPSSTPTSPPLNPPDPKPTGAIIGGAVGGFAVAALLTYGLVHLILRSRKEKRENLARTSTTSQPFTSPASGASEYKPHTGFSRETGYFDRASSQFDTLRSWHRGSGASGTTAFASPPVSPQSPGQGGADCVGGSVAEAGGREVRVYEAP